MQIDDKFFATVGMGDLDPARKQVISDQLSELIQNNLALTFTERLDEEQLDEFNRLMDEQGDEAAMAYVQQILPDYEQIVNEQTAHVVESFLSDMSMLASYQAKDNAE